MNGCLHGSCERLVLVLSCYFGSCDIWERVRARFGDTIGLGNAGYEHPRADAAICGSSDRHSCA